MSPEVKRKLLRSGFRPAWYILDEWPEIDLALARQHALEGQPGLADLLGDLSHFVQKDGSYVKLFAGKIANGATKATSLEMSGTCSLGYLKGVYAQKNGTASVDFATYGATAAPADAPRPLK